MFGFNSRNTSTGTQKRKRLPVFSIALIVCYITVAVVFFAYWFGNKEDGSDTPDEPAAEAPVIHAVPIPVVTPDQTVVEPVPLPPAVKVKGIYLGAWYIVDKERLDNYIELCETTEVNALVLDVKEDHGYVTFPVGDGRFPTTPNIVLGNMGELVEDLKSRGIYTIARVVCFKDPRRAARNPEMALMDSSGRQWRDRKDTAWLNPYERDNWEYIAEICHEAARLGFEEIQLDYVRFPADGRLSDIHYGEAGEEQTRAEVIAEFITFIRDEMLTVGVRTSADVFGIIALSDNDARIIGQELDLLNPALHYISPMIYPSHFANINQNGAGQRINGILFEAPDTQPYEVIYNTLQHFINRRDPTIPELAIIRPYLQDFTASYLGEGMFIEYGPEEVRAQIQAVYDAGLEEWILWSHTSRYNMDAFN